MKVGGEKAFALVNPRVPVVGRIGLAQIEVARVGSIRDELGRAAVAQSEAGGVGIDARLPAVANRQMHTTLAPDIQPVSSLLLGGERHPWRIHLEIFLALVE